MTNEQLIGAVLAVGAIAVIVGLVWIVRRLGGWWTDSCSSSCSGPRRTGGPSGRRARRRRRWRPAATPRSLGRGARVMSVSLFSIAAAMGIEYSQVAFSVPGASIEHLLEHLRTLFEAVWRVGMGFSFHALIVDYLAWRRISFGELLTNKPAPWRTEDEPFEPFASATVQAAAVLGYMGVLGVVLVIFGSLG